MAFYAELLPQDPPQNLLLKKTWLGTNPHITFTVFVAHEKPVNAYGSRPHFNQNHSIGIFSLFCTLVVLLAAVEM